MRTFRVVHLATVIVCLPLIYFAAAVVGAAWPGGHADLPAGDTVQIGLVRGPVHYDFLLPLSPDLRTRYAFSDRAGIPIFNPRAEWLLVGWGAQEFYTTVGSYDDLTAASIWNGMTGDTAVMHLDVAGPIEADAGVIWLPLSDAQYGALLDRIDDSFQHDQTGATVALTVPGLGQHDAFFAARGRFNLFHTCNAWIGETLRAAGIPIGIWTPTPQSVTWSVAWLAQG